jgi:hypothetical protein
VLMVFMAILLAGFAIFIGVQYFRLHFLPARFACSRAQYEIVCVRPRGRALNPEPATRLR